MAVVLVASQMGAFLQPDIVGIQVVWWEKEIDDSCFYVYVLLYWFESGSGLSIPVNNHGN
jgi:hypothetical protein